MSGKSQAKTISKASQVNRTIIEVLILTLLGAAAVALRARLRIHINMPGHHGLEVMALFIIARNSSKIPFAGSIAAIGGALLMLIPFFGFKNPFLPISYIMMGMSIDLLFAWFKSKRQLRFLFILLGGLAYMMIPISRLFLHILHVYPYQSIIKSGIPYTLISHFIYGAAGAALAVVLIYSARKIRK